MASDRKKKSLGSAPQLRPAQLEALLRVAIPAKKKVLIIGPPGVGKTSIGKQIAAELGYKCIIDHPVYNDPTDAKGIPWVNQETKQAEYFPAGQLAQVLSATEPTLWMLDDFAQASAAVQASYMPPLLDRTINGHPIPDGVSVIATANRRTDRAGSQGLLEPVKSRFDTIVELVINLEDSKRFYLRRGEENEYMERAAINMVVFLNDRPTLLHQFEPTADLRNSPCPRTWESVIRWTALFEEHPVPSDVELASYQGAVGDGAAAEYLSFLKVRERMPSLTGIILNPDKEHIPCQYPDAMYATSVGLAFKADPSNFGNIAVYLKRIMDHKCSEHKNGMKEFAALVVRDIHRHKPEISNTGAWIKLMAEGLCEAIGG